MEDIKKIQVKLVEMKNIMWNIKKPKHLYGINIIVDIEEENTSVLEDIVIETIQIKHREKKTEKIKKEQSKSDL